MHLTPTPASIDGIMKRVCILLRISRMSSWQDIVVEASELSFEGLDRSLEEVVDVDVAFASSSEEAAAVTSIWPLCRNFITLRPPRGREPWPNDNVESRWVCRDDDKKDAKDAGCCNKFNFCLRNAVSYEPSEDGGDGHEGNRYGVIHHRRRTVLYFAFCILH